jgi:hypothetical protein
MKKRRKRPSDKPITYQELKNQTKEKYSSITLDECNKIAEQMSESTPELETPEPIHNWGGLADPLETSKPATQPSAMKSWGGFPSDDQNSLGQVASLPVDGLPQFIKPALKGKEVSKIHSFLENFEPKIQSVPPPASTVFGYDAPSYGTAKKAKRPWESIEVQRTFTPELIAEEASSLTPSDVEDFDDLRSSFVLSKSMEKTLVFAIVNDKKNEDENLVSAIKCFGGVPFGGYAYDRSRDSYIVKCINFLQVGNIPFSYVLTMKNVGDWQVKVPIPEIVLEKYLTPRQRKTLNEYREKWPTPRYEVQLIQMLGCT